MAEKELKAQIKVTETEEYIELLEKYTDAQRTIQKVINALRANNDNIDEILEGYSTRERLRADKAQKRLVA